MGKQQHSSMALTGLVSFVLVAVALGAPSGRRIFSSVGDDPHVCQPTTVPKPLCHICIDIKWTQGACQGVNQMKCHARSQDGQAACGADGACSYYAAKKTCNDINVQNCPTAAVGIQGCIDYTTGQWKTGDAECTALRVHCENCVDGDCKGASPTPPTPPTPTPPTPHTPPTPTPPSPGKTCPWQTANVQCKTDADCGTWASANCNPGEVSSVVKPG